ncbi:hypothetical protein M758_1G093100 [Ceratodon purpureus]|nr:hypothetical protein M758_1G093100 [Ceratodon purpureus]
MAQERRVSFVAQAMKWRDPGDEGDGLLVLAPRPHQQQQQQSVFTRLGPKHDPPYVPQCVGEPPLAGMIFGCSPETYDECIGRQLFGLPAYKNKPHVMRIAPGAAIFLFNFRTKCMHGIFEATSHGGVHIIREAFGGKYEAQVKVRLVENCPVLNEKDFKDAIRENFRDAKKFDYPLSEAQVCRLKLLFRLKAAEDKALSIDLNHGRRVVQFCPAGPQQARNSIQVPRRIISSVSKDEVEVSITSAPPALSRVHVSSSQSRSRTLGGLEVSISSNEKKDKKRNGVSDSPRRHVVMYDTRREQSITLGSKSKIPKPARQEVVIEVVKEILPFRPSRDIPEDRKRRADTSPHGIQGPIKKQVLEQGQEIDEGGPGKFHVGDLRELLKGKRLKPSTKQKIKSVVSQPIDPPIYTGGNISIGDVLFIDDSKRNLERVSPLPRKKHSAITSGSLEAESLKNLVISRTSKKSDSTEEARMNGRTIRPIQDVQRKLKTVSVSADGIVQFRTRAGNHRAKANNFEGSILETHGSENGYSIEDKELKAANGDGVGGCVGLPTNFPVKSGLLQKLDDEIMGSCPGDEQKDGRLDIYVSLTVDEAENARQSNSPIVSENRHAIGHVVSCVLGKRTRGSKQDDTVLDSAVEPQALRAGTSITKRIEVSKGSPECSISKVLLTSANISETLQEREQGNYLSDDPLAEDRNLTSQVRTRNAGSSLENISEEGMRVDHVQSRPTNLLPLNDVVPVISTLIPNNAGDLTFLDCKRHRAGKENDPSSSTHKLDKIGHNEAGCSYVTLEVSTPTEGSDLREKAHKYEMPPQSSSLSLLSGRSGNLWNSRTLRYGKPRSSDTLVNHVGRMSSKSGSEPTSALEKSDPHAGSIKFGEESVYSGGENYGRRPEGSNATEASRTSGTLENQGALLVCELGNPGGLSLDSNMIRVDTTCDSLGKHQPSAVASVVQQFMLPTEMTLPSGPDIFQTKNTAVVPSSDGLESSEFRMGLAERESEAGDKICHPNDLPSAESVQPRIIASNEERAHPSLLLRKEPMPHKMEPIPLKVELMPLKIEPMFHRADAPEDARDLVVEDWLYARNRGSPSARTSTASLSDCSGPVGQPELEINIPIKEEELEICLPIEEDERVHAGTKSQNRCLCGVSNIDIKPGKLLQKNLLHNT